MSNRIGLVLLDYDQAEVTRRCLRSVAAGARRPDTVVLVENGATPVDLSSDELIASLDVTVLRPGRNLGAAGGRNLGVNELLDDTWIDRVALLDNDTVIPSTSSNAPPRSRWTPSRSWRRLCWISRPKS